MKKHMIAIQLPISALEEAYGHLETMAHASSSTLPPLRMSSISLEAQDFA